MNDAFKKFLYGQTALLIRGLKDIAALCDMKDEGMPPMSRIPSEEIKSRDALRPQNS